METDMSIHFAGAVVLAMGMLISAPAAAAATAADKRVACRTETQKMAQIIIRTRGKGGSYPALDKAKAKVGEEVWNAMLLAYEDNPHVSERDLATYGYSICVATAPAATK
jgi:hypothetical protein